MTNTHKKTKIMTLLGLIFTLAVMITFFVFKGGNSGIVKNNAQTTHTETPFGIQDIPYTIDGKNYIPKDSPPPQKENSSKEPVVRIFEQAYGDLNNDGINDVAVMLVKVDPLTKKMRFYASFVITQKETPISTPTVYLGEGIAPQNVSITDGRAIYNFAIRAPGQKETTQPSLGRSVYFIYNTDTKMLQEVRK